MEIETADEKIETPATSSAETVDDCELIELEANHGFHSDYCRSVPGRPHDRVRSYR
jgi:hypothetical protein